MSTNSREFNRPAERGLSATADSLLLARRRLSKAARTARQTITSSSCDPSTTAELAGYTTHRCLSTPYWDRTGDSSPQGALGYYCGGAYAFRHLTAEGLQGTLWLVVCWDGTDELTMHELQAFEASNPGITAEMLDQLPPQLAAQVLAVLPAPKASTSHAAPGPGSSTSPGPRSHHMRLSEFPPQLHSPSSSDMEVIRQFTGGRFSISSGLWPPSPVPEAPEAPAVALGARLLANPEPEFTDAFMAWAALDGWIQASPK